MIKRILDGDYLKNLDNIDQWQEVDKLNSESVSQHSYKVTIFARVLLEDLFGDISSSDPEIAYQICSFKLDVATRALLHDWDETLIRRDLSHVIKYNSFNGDALRKNIDDLAEHLATKEFAQIANSDGGLTASSAMMINQICYPVEAVQALVKVCDWLAQKFYCRREVAMGNKSFDRNIEYIDCALIKSVDTLESFLKASFPELPIKYEKLKQII